MRIVNINELEFGNAGFCQVGQNVLECFTIEKAQTGGNASEEVGTGNIKYAKQGIQTPPPLNPPTTTIIKLLPGFLYPDAVVSQIKII